MLSLETHEIRSKIYSITTSAVLFDRYRSTASLDTINLDGGLCKWIWGHVILWVYVPDCFVFAESLQYVTRKQEVWKLPKTWGVALMMEEERRLHPSRNGFRRYPCVARKLPEWKLFSEKACMLFRRGWGWILFREAWEKWNDIQSSEYKQSDYLQSRKGRQRIRLIQSFASRTVDVCVPLKSSQPAWCPITTMRRLRCESKVYGGLCEVDVKFNVEWERDKSDSNNSRVPRK